MAKITDKLQDLAEKGARFFCKKQIGFEYDDLFQVGLVSILEAPEGKGAGYYFLRCKTAILRHLEKERTRGAVSHSYGGDRKSTEFENAKELEVQFGSSKGLENIPESRLEFGIKKSTPDYESRDEEFWSENDLLTQRFLDKGEV